MEPKFADRIEWELTRACDLQCRHCYNAPQRPRRRELDTEEALTVASQLGRLGCRVVTLSGGEPTGRADWPQIAQVLSRSGVIVQLITNGQRFGRIEARLARAAGVGAVWLSVDGCANKHDDIRRWAGAFERLEVAARGLMDTGVPLGFVTTVVQDNADGLGDLADWVSQWDPAVWQIWLGVPQHGRQGWLAPEALPDLVDNLATLQKTHPFLTVGDNVGLGGHHCALRRADDLEAEAHDAPAAHCGAGHCEAGRGVLGLRSDGTITGCLALPGAHGVGNVRQSPLTQLWRAAGKARHQRLAQIAGACADCGHVAQCRGGCHAMALAATGRLDNPYCLNRPTPATQRPARRATGVAGVAGAAGVAASLAVASMLGAGCGPKEAPSQAAPSQAAPSQAARKVTPATTRDAGANPSSSPRQPSTKNKPGPGIPCQYSHIGCYHLRRPRPTSPMTPPKPTKPRRKP